VWEEPRPVGTWREPAWWDWALVAVLAPVGVLEGVLRPDVPYRVLSIVVTLGLLPALLWRRRHPLLVVALTFGLSALASLWTRGEPPQLNTLAYFVLFPYALFRWGSGREAVVGAAIMAAKVCVAIVAPVFAASDALAGLAVLSTICALGGAVRYRAGARLRERDQVVLLERERLARDLHDTVAHHVSAIAIRAQAGLATAAADPAAATEALRVIEAEASRTLAEMRGMVRVLRRDEPAELAPSPRVRDLERLAGRDGAGPPVDVEIVGDLDDLPPSVGAAIYRLAQESVTNARRHARHANRIEVRVAADDTLVRLRVSDDGEASGTGAQPGYGLLGMIERAHLLGGTCEAGPDAGRGWTVTAALPRTGWAT
jgi:signal transduction histidine kinase